MKVKEAKDSSVVAAESLSPALDKTWQRKHGYDAFRCPYCGAKRETRWRRGEEWFVCPAGHEDADVYRRQNEFNLPEQDAET